MAVLKSGYGDRFDLSVQQILTDPGHKIGQGRWMGLVIETVTDTKISQKQ